MYRWILVAGFVFVMFLGGQVTLLPTQVSAGPNDWCTCGYCMMSITNPGSCTCGPPYYWCLEDLMVLQLQASLPTGSAETNFTPVALTSTIATSDVTEQVVYLMSGGKCLHNKIVLHLLGNTKEEMKFIPVRFD